MIRHVLPTLLVLSTVTAACVGTPPAPRRTLTDDLGREVRVPERVERVVSLAPSVTELAVAAGGGRLVVGVTDADDYPAGVTQLPRVQALPVNREAVIALRPDLVLLSEQVNDPRDAEALAELGIASWFVRVDSLADVSRALRVLGGLLGTESAAGRAADSLDALKASMEASTGDAEPPSVLLLVGDRSLFSFGGGTYAHELIRLAGGRSVTASLTTKAPVLSDEFVLEAAPDIIVGAFGIEYDPATLLQHHPTWTLVPAVRDRAVFSIDADLVSRPGPRLFAGVLAIRNAVERATGRPSGGRP